MLAVWQDRQEKKSSRKKNKKVKKGLKENLFDKNSDSYKDNDSENDDKSYELSKYDNPDSNGSTSSGGRFSICREEKIAKNISKSLIVNTQSGSKNLYKN